VKLVPDTLESLAAVALSHADAPLDDRERLLDELARVPLERSFVFATCHRVELYTVAAPPRLVSTRRAATLRGAEAVRHLFRVAAGLESVIPGEVQVLGQLRRARGAVRGEPLLETLVQRALHAGREVRTRTALGSVTRSLGSLAVDEALRHIPNPTRATALVVGAGEMGKLASRALGRRVGTLLVANRGEERALQVAREVGAEAVALERIAEALLRADIVISAANTQGQVLSTKRLSARLARGPLVVIDLAVPRSVAAASRELAGLVYRTADDLREVASPPADAIAAAERICDEEAERFAAAWNERASAGVIQAIRERAHEVRRRQLARALAKLGHLDVRDREIVSSLAFALTNALLHEPTVALRAFPDRADAARDLFGVEERRA
jgi:glutamyl-tRNA reductase